MAMTEWRTSSWSGGQGECVQVRVEVSEAGA